MISKETVFVLGAGASFPYGFPLGRDLVFQISSCLTADMPSRAFIRNTYHKDDDDLNRFISMLVRSPLSVDAYLENHPEHLEMGKAAIALALIPHENPNVLVRTQRERKWYEYLFQQMGTSRDMFCESANNLCILTFNYDRSLEYFFYYALSDTFGETFTLDVLKQMRFVHLYGQLGRPTFLTYHYQDTSSNFRDYDPKLTDKGVVISANDIKIMPERSESSGGFPLAHIAISKAKILCLLGFGYDPINLKRLKILDLFHGQRLIGSALELGADERRRAGLLLETDTQRWAKQKRHRPTLARRNEDVLKVLKNYQIFE